MRAVPSVKTVDLPKLPGDEAHAQRGAAGGVAGLQRRLVGRRRLVDGAAGLADLLLARSDVGLQEGATW